MNPEEPRSVKVGKTVHKWEVRSATIHTMTYWRWVTRWGGMQRVMAWDHQQSVRLVWLTLSREFSRCKEDWRKECVKAGDDVEDGEGLVMRPPDLSWKLDPGILTGALDPSKPKAQGDQYMKKVSMTHHMFFEYQIQYLVLFNLSNFNKKCIIFLNTLKTQHPSLSCLCCLSDCMAERHRQWILTLEGVSMPSVPSVIRGLWKIAGPATLFWISDYMMKLNRGLQFNMKTATPAMWVCGTPRRYWSCS